MKHPETMKLRLPEKWTKHSPVQREAGFVQGVLLFALAVLVAIIAAFAFANNGSQNSAERENAKITATVLMKQATDVQDAIGRYITDGRNLGYLCVASSTSAIGSNDTCATVASAALAIDLFSTTNGYIAAPSPPQAAFKAAAGDSSRRWKFADFSAAGRAASATEVAPGYYAYMEAQDIDRKVCQNINRMLNLGMDATVSEPLKEQCYLSGTDTYIYRKVVATREATGL